MTKISPIITLILILFISPNLSEAKLDPDQIMMVDQIKPGMKAIGKTVFRGTEIEEFEVEILGVLRNSSSPKKDIIIAKATGDFLRHTGIMHGMSGSPIYINGKLIGAAAIAWQFMKEPIFGITPIKYLIEIADYPDLSEAGELQFLPSFEEVAERSSSNRATPLEIPIRGIDRKKQPELAKLEGWTMKPLQSPLMADGFSPKAMALFEEIFRNTSFVPMQGGSNASLYYDTSKIELEAGSAMGVQFARGDFNLSATGTVTFRDGDRIAAFGHPMFLSGDTAFPMTNAYVIGPMPNLASSWRMSVAGDMVGSITQDRWSGVAGNIGDTPEMFPVHIEVESPQSGRSEIYDYEIVELKAFAPMILLSTTLSAVEATEGSGEFSVDLALTLSIEGHPDIEVQDRFSGGSDAGFDLGLTAAIPLNALMMNTFEPIDVKAITMKIKYSPKPIVAQIAGMRVDRERVRPGETIEITAFLRPHSGDPLIKTFQIMIPEDTEEGPLIITVCDARTTQDIEVQRAPLRFQPKNLAHMIEIIQSKDRNNALIFELLRLELGATIQGQELPAIPPSMVAVLSGRRQTGEGGANLATLLEKQIILTDYEIRGCEFINVLVDTRARP